MKKETKFCPRCALENIKTKLKHLPNDLLSCPIGHWIGEEVDGKLQEVRGKIQEAKNCPRCALEGVKIELQNYPNHLLTCRRCQWVGRQVGDVLIQSVL